MIRHPPYLAFWAEYNVYVKSNPPPDKEKTELPLSVFPLSGEGTAISILISPNLIFLAKSLGDEVE